MQFRSVDYIYKLFFVNMQKQQCISTDFVCKYTSCKSSGFHLTFYCNCNIQKGVQGFFCLFPEEICLMLWCKLEFNFNIVEQFISSIITHNSDDIFLKLQVPLLRYREMLITTLLKTLLQEQKILNYQVSCSVCHHFKGIFLQSFP